MPFSCQLKFPSCNGSPVEAELKSWRRKPFIMLERGEAIADITIGDISYSLCVSFPCGLSGLIAEEGTAIRTVDPVATCGADGENVPDGDSRDYLLIRPF